ncbi:cupredoxin domain-containing protein [Streptomyces sp. NBC_01477]|uniref:cupredoxin domain-containing protein n=1 Tax=Streptomyces sp. NBC_01477 TaxID=2976015 RepID=UPI002E360627|nr:cupredoxin domain-containing protein [Streptomyces sp. NBC_01477]
MAGAVRGPRTRSRGVLGAVCLLVALTGCSSSGNGGSGSTASASAPASSSAAGGGADRIGIKNFAFGPATLTVKPGAVVTVTNNDSTTHTVTATAAKAFDTGDIAPGATKTFTAPAKAGSYPYMCAIHPFMAGTLTVG